MIKQREEEAGALGEVIRKVTHKGEIEIDSSEIGDRIVEVCLYHAAVRMPLFVLECNSSSHESFNITILFLWPNTGTLTLVCVCYM